jgi:DNA gyrase subunit A
MKLKGEDYIVGMEVVTQEEVKAGHQLMIIMENGYGKRTDVNEYGLQGRGGSGIKTAQITAKTGKLVSGRVVEKKDTRDLLVVSVAGQVIRTPVTNVSELGRATQGVKVMRFKTADDKVATATIVNNEPEASE